MAKGIAQRIVDAIWNDITDRRGLGDELEACEADVQNEIRKAWKEIVIEEMRDK